MKRMRIGLLMILIAALIMPSPNVFASETPESVPAEAPVAVELGAPKTVETPPPAPPAASTPQTSDLAPSTAQPETQDESIVTPSPSTTEVVKEKPALVEANTPAPQPAQPTAARTGKILITKVGYTGDGAQEFVELYNADKQPIDMTGWQLRTFKKTTMPHTVKKIGNVTLEPGKFYVVRGGTFVQPSEGDAPFDSVAKNILTENDAVEIIDRAGVKIDLVGWGKASIFEKTPAKTASASSKTQVLQRCSIGQLVVDSDDNRADFAAYETYGLRQLVACVEDEPEPEPIPDPPKPVNQCSGIRLSEIGANLDEQFIEVRNETNQTIDLAGCGLKTNRSKKVYEFGAIELAAGDFLAVKVKNTPLTLTKASSGTVYLLNGNGDEIEEQAYDHLAKGSSWSLIDGEWVQTYTATPGAANSYQKWLPCPMGKVRNEETGSCIKLTQPAVEPELKPCQPWQYRNPETGRCKNYAKAATVKPCKEGQYRSEETGRCRSIASAAAKTLKPCRDDQFRNPATGRCKKIAADSDVLKECAEGFERNPKTNRCRKVVTASMPQVGFAPEQVKQVAGATWGWWVFGGVSLLALAYAGWQWRWEIGRAMAKVGAVFTSGKK